MGIIERPVPDAATSAPKGTTAAASDHLSALPKLHDEFVFPNRDGSGSADLKKAIAALFDDAGLKDARSHDLRRTFASIAAELGYGDATIAELLGHARRGVTERHYVGRPDAVLIEAASRTGQLIAAALDGKNESRRISSVGRTRTHDNRTFAADKDDGGGEGVGILSNHAV
jgi:Phage integrase family